jgi:hypothetical protein
MGQKITLQNTGSNIGYISYQNLGEQDIMQTSVTPGQILTIWCETNTLNVFAIPNSNIVTLSTEAFPPSSTPPTVTPQKESILFLTQIASSPNWQSYVFDYDTAKTVGPLDTGFNYSNYQIWCCPSILGLPKSGYMVFLNYPGGPEVGVKFYNYQGTQIGSYQNESDNWDYYLLGGSFLVFIDYDNGNLIYSDGNTVNTIEWNTSNDFEIDTNYDDSISNKFLIYSGNGYYSTYQLVDMNGVTPFVNYDNRYYDVSIPKYQTGNFIPALFYVDNGTYSFFNIYDSTGRIIQEVDLTNLGYNYNDFDINFYGANQMNIIFYNDLDVNVPYRIYNYNGDTNTLNATSHDRGDNYGYWDTYYDSSACGVAVPSSEDFHMLFYDNQGNWIDDSWTVGYADVVSFFKVNQEFTTYIFNDTGSYDYWVNYYEVNVNESFQMLVNNDSTYLSVLTVTPDDNSINDVCQLLSLVNYYFDNGSYNGDTFIFMVEVTGGYIAYAYDMMGNQLDARPLVSGYDYDTNFNTFYIQDNNNNGWYFNNETNNFISIGYYNNTYFPYWTSQTFTSSKNGYPLLLRNNNDVRVLYNNSVTSIFTLPTTYDVFSIDMSDYKFMYTYTNSNNKIVAEVYDLTFNIVASQTTNESIIDSHELYRDRALVVTDTGSGNLKTYFISNGGNNVITTLDANYGFAPNDNFWWC